MSRRSGSRSSHRRGDRQGRAYHPALLAGTSLLSPDEDFWPVDHPWHGSQGANSHSWLPEHTLLGSRSRPGSRPRSAAAPRSSTSSSGTRRSTRPSKHAARESQRYDLDVIVQGTGFDAITAVVVPLDQGAGTKDDKELHVLKFRSKKTGMNVVWVDAEGPLVQGYTAVATEIFDDTGRPHTLEHLCFMGSRKFPHNGILDLVANRSFGDGTNAWTENMQTVYTISTASASGFLDVLEVYMDHIIDPLLTDSAFVTEVYSPDPTGADSGTVFAEMSAREHAAGDIVPLALREQIYREGKSAYRSETGGLEAALRTLTIEKIRRFHKRAYIPRNITLIVVGASLSPRALLTRIDARVEKGVPAQDYSHIPRSFIETDTAKYPAYFGDSPKDTEHEVIFPIKDESVGRVMTAFAGPSVHNFLETLAVNILISYVAGSGVSPMYEHFVEAGNTACGNMWMELSPADPHIINITFVDVKKDRLHGLGKACRQFFEGLVRQEVDTHRMASIIEKDRNTRIDSLENSPGDLLSGYIMKDALFGRRKSDLKDALSDLAYYRVLSSWPSLEWVNLIRKYFVSGASVTMVGIPSAKAAAQLDEEVKRQPDVNVERYMKKNGLKDRASTLAWFKHELEAAEKANKADIPDSEARQFKIPQDTSIQWRKIKTARSPGVAAQVGLPDSRDIDRGLQAHIESDPTRLSLFLQFDHYMSRFIEFYVVISFGSVAREQVRSLLPVFVDLWSNTSMYTGPHRSYEFCGQILRELEVDVISSKMQANEPLGESISVSMKVVKEKYAGGVQWLQNMLYGPVYDASRLRLIAKQSLDNLTQEKENGDGIAMAGLQKLVKQHKSATDSTNIFTKVKYLREFLHRLDTEPDQVLADFKEFRVNALDPAGLKIHVKGDIFSLEKPLAPWAGFARGPQFGIDGPRPLSVRDLHPIPHERNFLSPLGERPAQRVQLFGLSSIQTTYSYHACSGPFEGDDPTEPALTVARQVLNGINSILWKAIRGRGLAYGVWVEQSLPAGLVYLHIFKAPNSYKAFKAVEEIINDVVVGKEKISHEMMETAKSTLTFQNVNHNATFSDAAYSSFYDQCLMNRPKKHTMQLLDKMHSVTLDEVHKAIVRYVLPIFNPATSIGSVACAVGRLDAISRDYSGHKVDTRGAHAVLRAAGKSAPSSPQTGGYVVKTRTWESNEKSHFM